MRIYILIILLLSLPNFFCRPTRNISRVIHKKDSIQTTCFASDSLKSSDNTKLSAQIFNQINHNITNFKTFSAKIKIHYGSRTEKDADFTAFVRIQKDSIVWLSLTGTLGIEGFRLLVTPDKVQIMDKLHKTIQNLPFSHLQEITKLPLDFKTLQNLIVGNPTFANAAIISCTEYNNHILVSMADEYFKQTITMDKPDNRIVQTKMDDLKHQNNLTCNISVAAFEMKNNQWFPTERNVTIVSKTQTDITLNTKSFSINETLTFPFNIPKNYAKKS